MFWFCVRSQRIFSEKQFWHVLESSCAAEEPLAGSEASAAGGASDMVAKSGGAPHSTKTVGHREKASSESSAFRYESEAFRTRRRNGHVEAP